jgi:hypothetical protein
VRVKSLVKRLWARFTDPGPWAALAEEVSAEVEAARQCDGLSLEVQCGRLRVANAGLREELAAVTAERDELLVKFGDDAPTRPMPPQMATVIAQMAELETENAKFRAERESAAGQPVGGSATELGRARETIARLEADVARLTRASMARDAAGDRRRRMRRIRGWSR